MKKNDVIQFPHHGVPFIDNENARLMWSDGTYHHVKLVQNVGLVLLPSRITQG